MDKAKLEQLNILLTTVDSAMEEVLEALEVSAKKESIERAKRLRREVVMFMKDLSKQ